MLVSVCSFENESFSTDMTLKVVVRVRSYLTKDCLTYYTEPESQSSLSPGLVGGWAWVRPWTKVQLASTKPPTHPRLGLCDFSSWPFFKPLTKQFFLQPSPAYVTMLLKNRQWVPNWSLLSTDISRLINSFLPQLAHALCSYPTGPLPVDQE